MNTLVCSCGSFVKLSSAFRSLSGGKPRPGEPSTDGQQPHFKVMAFLRRLWFLLEKENLVLVLLFPQKHTNICKQSDKVLTRIITLPFWLQDTRFF